MQSANTIPDAIGTAAQVSAFDELPPSNVEAERCVLSAMIIADTDDPIIDEMLGIVRREDFYSADHAIIFEVLLAMRAAGIPAAAELIVAELRRRQLLEEIGGTSYLAEIIGKMPGPLTGPHYARLVRETADLRSLIGLFNDGLREVYGPTAIRDRAGSIAQRQLEQLVTVQNRSTGHAIHAMSSIVVEAYEATKQGGVPCVKTGFRDLDAEIDGLGFGEMWVLAGRPSMGKSATSKQIACYVAQHHAPAGIIAIEENRRKIGRNVLSTISGVNNKLLRSGKVSDDETRRLAEAARQVAEWRHQVYVVETAHSLEDVCAQASIMVARHKVQLLVIDYLQRIECPGFRSEYERVTHVSLQIANLIKRLNVAALVVAQLSRPPKQGGVPPRPRMDDLRSSGQIEQDADGVLLLHSEDYYRRGESDYTPKGTTEVIVAKSREGPRENDVVLRRDMARQMLIDFDESEPPAWL